LQWQITFAGQGWHFKNLFNGKYLAHEGKAQNGSRVVVQDEPFLWNIFGDAQIPLSGR